jgi:hypothetical protein
MRDASAPTAGGPPNSVLAPAAKPTDDGTVGGPPLDEGRIGFRQMAPLIAEYANLRIRQVEQRRAFA